MTQYVTTRAFSDASYRSEFDDVGWIVLLQNTSCFNLACVIPMLLTPPNFTSMLELDPTDVDAARIDFWFRDSELLVESEGLAPAAFEGAGTIGNVGLVVGKLGESVAVANVLPADTAIPHGTRWIGLRALFGVIPDELVALAGRAAQLVQWDRDHRHCGRCATPTLRQHGERARRCESCGLSAYPRISPAMMCLVTRGKEILLARNVAFPPGRYSALAGFLEAGESVEDAVHREVREEVGIEVGEPTYFGSQSWPFPHSLMIAFTAEYVRGALKPNGHEIAEAEWFSVDKLPQLPPRMSIARALIDHTLQKLHGT